MQIFMMTGESRKAFFHHLHLYLIIEARSSSISLIKHGRQSKWMYFFTLIPPSCDDYLWQSEDGGISGNKFECMHLEGAKFECMGMGPQQRPDNYDDAINFQNFHS